MDVEKPSGLLRPLIVNRKTMMGPGPSNCSPRALHALSLPILGHMREETFQIMDDIKSGLRYVFQTRNEMTLVLSASGHGGMEAAMCNLVEPGDKVLVAVNGFWGQRAMDIASRNGGITLPIEVEPGKNFKLCTIEEAIKRTKPKLFFITQGESSTGVLQPISGIGEICRRFDCLLVVDTVASLGAVDVFADRWLVDCIYSGSQKVLGAPSGLAPISFSPRAVNKILYRKTPIPVYCFDMTLLAQYWGCFPGKARIYHHTISTTLLYALREGLALLVEEGIENSVKRHQASSCLLQEGLTRLGFQLFVKEPEMRLPSITTAIVPEGHSWKKIIQYCLKRHHLEVGAGLGPTAGKVIRIGVMGYNANEETVRMALDILKSALTQENSKL